MHHLKLERRENGGRYATKKKRVPKYLKGQPRKGSREKREKKGWERICDCENLKKLMAKTTPHTRSVLEWKRKGAKSCAQRESVGEKENQKKPSLEGAWEKNSSSKRTGSQS